MWSKIAIPLIGVLIGGTCGIIGGIKMAKPAVCNCPQIPELKCPESNSMRVQTLDIEKLKKLRQFTYAPVFEGTVYMVNEKDTIKSK